MKTVTRCPKNRDEMAGFRTKFVTLSVTSISIPYASERRGAWRAAGGKGGEHA